MYPNRFLLAFSFLTLAAAQAAPTFYTAILDGPSESPPVASPGTGLATVSYDPVSHILTVAASFSGLTGTTTAAHIHAPTAVPLAGTAGVATQTPSFAGFPLGVTAGLFSSTYDLTLASSFNPAFVTANGGVAAAEAAFASALAGQRAYFNIHTSTFGGGEIRGFLVASVPDESPALVLLMFSLTALAAVRHGNRCRRKIA